MCIRDSSTDVQNVPQTQTPTFDLSNDKTAEITSKKLVDPATGQPTDETTVTVAGEGSYTIDPTTGAVTFTPEKDFVGTEMCIRDRSITISLVQTIQLVLILLLQQQQKLSIRFKTLLSVTDVLSSLKLWDCLLYTSWSKCTISKYGGNFTPRGFVK